MNGQNATSAYASTQAHSAVFDASPHKLISLLFSGAQTHLSQAKRAMLSNDIAARGRSITKAIDIVNNLQACLDQDKGGQVASNLDSLYDYMIRRLAQANVSNDAAMIDEVSGLIEEIKIGWDAIASEANA